MQILQSNHLDWEICYFIVPRPNVNCLFVQGFLPVEASILGVEVWGLGGKTTKEKQDTFKKRESLFSEQRRKVA